METRLTSRGPGIAALLLLLGAASTATAHEHHMDNIPQGQAISDDPIVRSASAQGRCATVRSYTS